MSLSNDIWGRWRFCRGSNSEKKWNWPYPLNLLVYFDKILHTHYYWHDLDRRIAKSSPSDCKMTFNIGRGCAELQILKKWKWPNWVDYFDEALHTHWYWQEIVKCHLGLAEALPRFKFWKTVKLALSLETFWIPYNGIFSRRQIFAVLSKKTWALFFADFNFRGRQRLRKIISIHLAQFDFPSIDQLCGKKISGQSIWNAREWNIRAVWQTNKQKEPILIFRWFNKMTVWILKVVSYDTFCHKPTRSIFWM